VQSSSTVAGSAYEVDQLSQVHLQSAPTNLRDNATRARKASPKFSLQMSSIRVQTRKAVNNLHTGSSGVYGEHTFIALFWLCEIAQYHTPCDVRQTFPAKTVGCRHEWASTLIMSWRLK
jgi:hypothetical protein